MAQAALLSCLSLPLSSALTTPARGAPLPLPRHSSSTLRSSPPLRDALLRMSASESMKAIVLPTDVEDRSASALTQEQLPIPALERPRDLLVKVVASSVNPIDYKMRSTGTRVTGYDVSGVVTAVGDETSLFKVGDEVFYAGDFSRQGAFAEYHVVDERIVGNKPKKLTHAEAAAMPLTSLTAWEAMVEQMGIPTDKEANAGKTILIMAGAGGVGSVAIQIAKVVLGLRVVAAASREETAQFAKSQGADLIISGRGDIKQELEDVGVTDGVEYIFDTVNHKYFDRYLPAIKACGRICSTTGCDGLDLGELEQYAPRKCYF